MDVGNLTNRVGATRDSVNTTHAGTGDANPS